MVLKPAEAVLTPARPDPALEMKQNEESIRCGSYARHRAGEPVDEDRWVPSTCRAEARRYIHTYIHTLSRDQAD
jgi:hypothetical protein